LSERHPENEGALNEGETLDHEPPAASAQRRPARFTPGEMVGGRYRIVALLGRGGMGEVYRADDTKLGQPVALKFLPESLARDPARLERLFAEVRIGRQISHPNVCRLYDVTESDGHHFVAMEYVDGEDLASLLRRIGRLPADKALEIARQLCAGLAAAHDRGVVHRDLKPANVMIDGHGVARLTDFGLAALADEMRAGELAGTPAYMSPEQLDAGDVTIRSDLYSLGLVLYEIFTGKRRFEAQTLSALRAQHREAHTLSLSSTVRDVDPAVDRLISRCLAEDPALRPPSAHAVIAALPGGDPLQAALAAGETPSPEMVAAAGRVGDLAPGVAWACLGGVLAGLVTVSLLSAKTMLFRRVPLPKSTEVLVEHVGELLARLGYESAPADTFDRFILNDAHVRYVREHGSGSGRWDQLASGRPSPILFEHRQSPRHMLALNADSYVGEDDPPSLVSGMIDIVLDPSGRLMAFTAVPPQRDDSKRPFADPDFTLLMSAAGLDAAQVKTVEPSWTAPVDSDRKAAWDGTYPGQSDVPIHVEAAAYHGKPVWFAVLGPWSRAARQLEDSPSTVERVVQWASIVLFVLLQIGAVFLARRNLRLGRGDRRGALALSGFIFFVRIAEALVRAHHVASLDDEIGILIKTLAFALYFAALTWVVYMALEPYLRRRWPHMLIAWNRLLAGRVRDPLVGRDLLVGTLVGLAVSILGHVLNLAPSWFGKPQLSPIVNWLSPLTSSRHLIYAIVRQVRDSVMVALAVPLCLLLLRVILRRQVLAVIALGLLLIGLGVRGENLAVDLVGGVLFTVLFLGLLLRFGLLAVAGALYVNNVVDFVPMTLDPSLWWAGRSFLVFGVLLALSAYAFYTSLAGKPMFGGAFED
jgi:serine/threonine-protein kinase